MWSCCHHTLALSRLSLPICSVGEPRSAAAGKSEESYPPAATGDCRRMDPRGENCRGNRGCLTEALTSGGSGEPPCADCFSTDLQVEVGSEKGSPRELLAEGVICAKVPSPKSGQDTQGPEMS